MTTRFSGLIALSFLLLVTGCIGPREQSEPLAPPDLVASEPVIEEMVSLLNNDIQHQNLFEEKKEYTICFPGVRFEDGRSFDAFSTLLRKEFESLGKYEFIPEEKITETIHDQKLKENDLFLPRERKKLIQSLDPSTDYLMRASITHKLFDKGAPSAPNELTIELVRLSEGQYVKRQIDLKEDYIALTQPKKKSRSSNKK